MNWLALFSATAWVDFVVIVLSKFFPLTKTLGDWYRDFGVVAVASDILIIVLGIALAQLIVPGISGWNLVGLSVLIQVIHDVLFYIGIIRGVPDGQNKIIDLFKRYAAEGSWKIIVADSAMVASSVLLMEWLDNNLSDNQVGFVGVLAVYSLLYIIYTK
jgi:hypothetical protein